MNIIQTHHYNLYLESSESEYNDYDPDTDYDRAIQRDLLEDQLDYSESLANSDNSGWMYSEPDYQDYRHWLIYDEPEYGYGEEG